MNEADFIKIAEIIENAQESDGNQCYWIAIDLCEYLATTNTQFNKEEFLKACGVEE